MRVIAFAPECAAPIQNFESVGAAAVALGDGVGEAHMYCLYFGPGSRIGEHLTGFGQLFLVVNGQGWAAGADGRRIPLSMGQGAYFERGERHSKGSESGMTAIMVQVDALTPRADGDSDDTVESKESVGAT